MKELDLEAPPSSASLLEVVRRALVPARAEDEPQLADLCITPGSSELPMIQELARALGLAELD